MVFTYIDYIDLWIRHFAPPVLGCTSRHCWIHLCDLDLFCLPSDMLRSIVIEQIANLMVLPNVFPIKLAEGIDLNKLKYPQPQVDTCQTCSISTWSQGFVQRITQNYATIILKIKLCLAIKQNSHQYEGKMRKCEPKTPKNCASFGKCMQIAKKKKKK